MAQNEHYAAGGKPYDEPSTVIARGGEVIVHGPDDVSVVLTPDAAAETSDRLLHASAQAMGQRIEDLRRAEEDAARHRR